MRFIREGRFGPPKTWKTGAVVGTYPRPLLVLEYEAGGLEIIRDPIVETKVADLATIEPEGIVCLDFSRRTTTDLEQTYSPAKDVSAFADTVATINQLRRRNPFKTVVIDTVTGLSDSIWSHQAVTNDKALADPRKWAGNIGMKVGQVIDYVTALPCNSVFIFHTEVDKDEITGRVAEQPMVYSKLRNWLGAKFSQFLYQQYYRGEPVVRVKPFEVVTGIGCRWPTFDKEIIGPTFNAIYGKEDVYR